MGHWAFCSIPPHLQGGGNGRMDYDKAECAASKRGDMAEASLILCRTRAIDIGTPSTLRRGWSKITFWE